MILTLAAFLVILPAAVFADGTGIHRVLFTVGQPYYWDQTGQHHMDAAPVIINGRTYLPVRYVAEAMGMQVGWDQGSKEVWVIQPTLAQPTPTVGDKIQTSTIADTTNYYMAVTVTVTGPAGTKSILGDLDTGSSASSFPDSFLRSLGYSPSSGPYNMTMETSTGTAQQSNIYVYTIAYPSIPLQNGKSASLGKGELRVVGSTASYAVPEALIGLDILSQDHLTLNGNTWSLTVPPAQ